MVQHTSTCTVVDPPPAVRVSRVQTQPGAAKLLLPRELLQGVLERFVTGVVGDDWQSHGVVADTELVSVRPRHQLQQFITIQVLYSLQSLHHLCIES